MGKVYVNQKKLRIRLWTKQDLSGAGIVARMKYRKPDGTVGYWTATIEAPAMDGYIYKDMNLIDYPDVAGHWIFWAYIIFPTTLPAPGEAVHIKFYTEPN